MASQWNPQLTLGGASWAGNVPVATKPQLLSTSSGQTYNLLSTSLGQTTNLLSTSAGLSQANNSTNIIGLSSIAGWSLYPAISTINAAGNNIVNINFLSTLDLQVSSINGADIKIFNSTVVIQGVTITNNTVAAGTVEKTTSVTDTFNSVVGAVGSLVDVAQKAVGGALADTGAVLQQVYWGTAATNQVVNLTNGVVTLATGIQGLIDSRQNNTISGGNAPGQTTNVYETINGTTQFQFSTLGSAVTTVFRTTDQKNPNITLGREVFISTIIPAGSKAVRSVSDPLSMPILSTQLLSTTNYLQSFGQWHAILEPDYALSTSGLTNIGTFCNQGPANITGITNLYNDLYMNASNIYAVNNLFTTNIKNTGILSNLTFCNVGNAYFTNTGSTYFQKSTIFSYDATFSGANLQMAGNSISNINNLNATYANIGELEVSSLKASTVTTQNIIDNFVSTTSAELDTAKISSIFGNYAAISSISSQTIFTPVFSSLQGYISSFRSDTAFTTRLSSLQGYISSFQSDTALIPNLSTGTITGLPNQTVISNTYVINYSGAPVFLDTLVAGGLFIDVQLSGAAGKSIISGVGGSGGFVRGRYNIKPGSRYSILVGQGGASGSALYGSVGGGGAGVPGGGGTYLYEDGVPVVIAAGGGGASASFNGGNGGGFTGQDGSGTSSGKGATQTAGGAGGIDVYSGTAGTAYQGGFGQNFLGGGGGGGLYGGGGAGASGSAGSGGGGGSSYIANLYYNPVSVSGGGATNGRNGTATLTVYKTVDSVVNVQTQQLNLIGNAFINGDLSGGNFYAATMRTLSASISTLTTANIIGPSTINFSVFPSTNVFTVNKKSINTFVFGISQSYNGNNINGVAVIKDGNNNQFKISEWACSVALQGVYEFAGLHTASAFNYIDTHLVNSGGVWAVFFNVYTNVDRGGNNGAINWDVTMTPLELTQVQPAGFSALPPNSTITLSTVTYAYPNTFISTLLASTLTISAIENISLNAATGIPTFLGNGNIALNANSNIDLMANYDIIAGAGHDITLNSSNDINLNPNNINITATNSFVTLASTVQTIADIMTFTAIKPVVIQPSLSVAAITELSTINGNRLPWLSTYNTPTAYYTATGSSSGTPQLITGQSLSVPYPGDYVIRRKIIFTKATGDGSQNPFGCLFLNTGDNVPGVSTGVAVATLPFTSANGISTFTTLQSIFTATSPLTRNVYYYDQGALNYTASLCLGPPTLEFIPPPQFLAAPVVPFDPTSLAAPLITWFDGTVGLTSSSWTNRGTDGGAAPLYYVSIGSQNGLPCAYFPDQYSYGYITQNFTGDSRAVFAVYAMTSQTVGINSYLLAQYNSGFFWSAVTYIPGTGQAQYLQVNNGYTLIEIDDAITIDTTQMTTVAMAYDATGSNTNSYITYNGNPTVLTYYADAGLNTSAVSYINGGGISGSGAAVGGCGMTLCELLAYDGVVSPSDGSNVVNYLRTKWGTP